MKLLYLDYFAGISGDVFLGALVQLTRWRISTRFSP